MTPRVLWILKHKTGRGRKRGEAREADSPRSWGVQGTCFNFRISMRSPGKEGGLFTGLASYYHLVFRIYIFIQIETLDKLNLHLFHLIVIALYSHLIISIQQQQQQQYHTISFAFFTVMSASPGNYIEKEWKMGVIKSNEMLSGMWNIFIYKWVCGKH